jgi:hypothetical protein
VYYILVIARFVRGCAVFEGYWHAGRWKRYCDGVRDLQIVTVLLLSDSR